MKIAMVGCGKLGGPVALALEHYGGHDVVGVDASPQVTEAMASRRWPHREEGVADLLASSSLRLVSVAEAVAHAEVIFVAVQTPHGPEYEGVTRLPQSRADFDYHYLRAACADVCREVAAQEKPVVLAVISTVLPGTMAREIVPLLNPYVRLVYNPAFIAMGTCIGDVTAPEFLLLGGDDADSVGAVERVYASIHRAPRVRVRIVEAEFIKVLYNVALGFKLALANMTMEVCDRVGGDADAVMGALGHATQRLWSARYLRAGMGDGGACLPAGELVFTEDGPLPIESVEPGMRVLARDGTLHHVVQRYERQWSGDLVSIQTWGAPPVRFTPDHPLLVADDQRSTYLCHGRLKHHTAVKVVEALTAEHERAAEAVKVGDFLPLTIPIDEVQASPPPHATDEYVELAGYYLSNGSLDIGRSVTTGRVRHGRLTFSMHARAVTDHDRIGELCIQLDPPTLSGRRRTARVSHQLRPPFCVNIRYGSSVLAEHFESDFGRGAARKRLPSWIVYGPRRLIEKIIIGMWRGDGCAYPGGMHFSTASPHLAYGMQLMFARCGIPMSIRKIPPRAGVHKGSFGRVPTYEVGTGNAKHLGQLSRLVGMSVGHGKVQKLYDRYPERDGAFMRAVRSIRREPFCGTVHNLWVDRDHTFTTPVGTVHNCHGRDQIALSWFARIQQLSTDLFSTVMEARERHAEWLAALVEREAHVSGLPIVVLGRAYKPGTNLVDGSAATLLGALLEERGVSYCWHDPHVASSPMRATQAVAAPAVFFHATAHPEFASYVLASGSVAVDPWGTLPLQHGVRFVRPGRMPRELVG